MIHISKRIKRDVPFGRTLSTYDYYLDKKSKSTKKRPVVVIDKNKRNEFAVVALSSREGKHRTRLKNYQDGKSFFKHFVETRDDEGAPIVIGKKFRENHPRNDISRRDVLRIRKIVFEKSVPAQRNREKMKNFHK